MAGKFPQFLLLLLVVASSAVAKKFWAGHPSLTHSEFKEIQEKLRGGQYALTYFELRNFAKGNITDTKVTVQNSSDWDNKFTPMKNLQHWQIESKFSVICPEIVNRSTNSSIFTMTLFYADKTVEIFQINQQALFGEPLDFKHTMGKRRMNSRIVGLQLEVIVYEDKKNIPTEYVTES